MTGDKERLRSALADRYRIERELGAGGMATVYLAYDVRHDRKVALKVLRPELSAILGGERFLAEIKTTANLQHPHILSLFDSGEADGLVFYVMPYVEGESLRDRLNREKQLPVDDAVRIAREVLDALAYAHERGVVHRDIKPENILLHGGHALVADFGIALAASRSEGGTRMTETGMSLGTPHYMSPEQAMGEREITPKADVYAVGCVLYESLTGEPPFTGPTPQAIVARVMTEEPRSLTLQRRTIPPHVEAAVTTALAKLPADRFAGASAFAEALGRSDYTTATTRAMAAVPGRRRRLAPLAAVGVAGALLGAAAVALTRGRERPAGPELRYAIESDSGHAIGQNFAISPDGTVLVFRAYTPGGPLLFRRNLSALEPAPIPGTADAAEDPNTITFSPDGASIVYLAASGLRRVRLDGTDAQTVATIDGIFGGASWAEDGTIVYSVYPTKELRLIPAQGGTPTRIPVHGAAGDVVPISPQFLPGGRTALCVNAATATIGVVTLATGEFKPVVRGVSPAYLPSGFLVYAQPDGSMAMRPFDAGRADTTGPARSLPFTAQPVYDVEVVFRLSPSGMLVYRPRAEAGVTLQLVQRYGAATALTQATRLWGPRFTPDGRRVLYGGYRSGTTSDADLWSFVLQAGTDQRITSGGQEGRDFNDATPSPDGRWLALSAVDSGAPGKDLYLLRSDGDGPPVRLLERPGSQFPTGWTPDGRSLLFTDGPANAPTSIWMIAASGGAPVPLVQSPYSASGGRVSPDGRWLAFQSDETGQAEVYVQRFPSGGGKLRISAAGGMMPVWAHRGNELFYSSRGKLLSALLRAGGDLSVVERRELFPLNVPSGSLLAQYDVSPDDQRFVLASTPSSTNRVVVAVGLFEHAPR